MPSNSSSLLRKPLRHSGRTKHSAVSKPPRIKRQHTKPQSMHEGGTHTLFVDGSNLYSAHYKLFGPQKFLHFAQWVREVERATSCRYDRIYFYASYTPRTPKQTLSQIEFSKNEFLFYKSAKSDTRVEFFTGYRSPTSGKEKEVDVKLAGDMVYMALTKQVSSMVLCTGDADFLQALKLIKNHDSAIPLALLCLENRVMFRGSFEFPTTIVSFDLPKKFDRLPKNISHLCLNTEKLIAHVSQPPPRLGQKKAPRSFVRGKDKTL